MFFMFLRGQGLSTASAARSASTGLLRLLQLLLELLLLLLPCELESILASTDSKRLFDQSKFIQHDFCRVSSVCK